MSRRNNPSLEQLWNEGHLTNSPRFMLTVDDLTVRVTRLGFGDILARRERRGFLRQ